MVFLIPHYDQMPISPSAVKKLSFDIESGETDVWLKAKCKKRKSHKGSVTFCSNDEKFPATTDINERLKEKYKRNIDPITFTGGASYAAMTTSNKFEALANPDDTVDDDKNVSKEEEDKDKKPAAKTADTSLFTPIKNHQEIAEAIRDDEILEAAKKLATLDWEAPVLYSERLGCRLIDFQDTIQAQSKDPATIARALLSNNAFRQSKGVRRLLDKLGKFESELKTIHEVVRALMMIHPSAESNNPRFDYYTSEEEGEKKDNPTFGGLDTEEEESTSSSGDSDSLTFNKDEQAFRVTLKKLKRGASGKRGKKGGAKRYKYGSKVRSPPAGIFKPSVFQGETVPWASKRLDAVEERTPENASQRQFGRQTTMPFPPKTSTKDHIEMTKMFPRGFQQPQKATPTAPSNRHVTPSERPTTPNNFLKEIQNDLNERIACIADVNDTGDCPRTTLNCPKVTPKSPPLFGTNMTNDESKQYYSSSGDSSPPPTKWPKPTAKELFDDSSSESSSEQEVFDSSDDEADFARWQRANAPSQCTRTPTLTLSPITVSPDKSKNNPELRTVACFGKPGTWRKVIVDQGYDSTDFSSENEDYEMQSITNSIDTEMDTGSDTLRFSQRTCKKASNEEAKLAIYEFILETAMKFDNNKSLMLELLPIDLSAASVSAMVRQFLIEIDESCDSATTLKEYLHMVTARSELKMLLFKHALSLDIDAFKDYTANTYWLLLNNATDDFTLSSALNVIRAVDVFRFQVANRVDEPSLRTDYPNVFKNTFLQSYQRLQVTDALAIHFDTDLFTYNKEYVSKSPIYNICRSLIPSASIRTNPPDPIASCSDSTARRIVQQQAHEERVMREGVDQASHLPQVLHDPKASGISDTPFDKAIAMIKKMIHHFSDAKAKTDHAAPELKSLFQHGRYPRAAAIIGRDVSHFPATVRTSPPEYGEGKFTQAWVIAEPFTVENARQLPPESTNEAVMLPAEGLEKTFRPMDPTKANKYFDGLSHTHKCLLRVTNIVDASDPSGHLKRSDKQYVAYCAGHLPTITKEERRALTQDHPFNTFQPEPCEINYNIARHQSGLPMDDGMHPFPYHTPSSILATFFTLKECVTIAPFTPSVLAIPFFQEERFDEEKRLLYTCEDPRQVPITHAQGLRLYIVRNTERKRPKSKPFKLQYAIPPLADIVGPNTIYDLVPPHCYIHHQADHPEFDACYQTGTELRYHDHSQIYSDLQYSAEKRITLVAPLRGNNDGRKFDLTPYGKSNCTASRTPPAPTTQPSPFPNSRSIINRILLENNHVSKTVDISNAYYTFQMDDTSDNERICVATTRSGLSQNPSDDDETPSGERELSYSFSEDEPLRQTFATQPFEAETEEENSVEASTPIVQHSTANSLLPNVTEDEQSTEEILTQQTNETPTPRDQPATNIEKGVNYLLKLMSPNPATITSSSQNAFAKTPPSNPEESRSTPHLTQYTTSPHYPVLDTPVNHNNANKPIEQEENIDITTSADETQNLLERRHGLKKLNIETTTRCDAQDSQSEAKISTQDQIDPSDTLNLKDKQQTTEATKSRTEGEDPSQRDLKPDSSTPKRTNARRQPVIFDGDDDDDPSDSEDEDDISEHGKRKRALLQPITSDTKPSAEYLTKTLLRAAKNSNLRKLHYPPNMEARRKQYNAFIDNLKITCNISPWTCKTFSQWPEQLIYSHPSVGTAIFNVVYAYLSGECQQQLDLSQQDGNDTLLFLKRRMAPITPDYIDTCHETFRLIKQSNKESASLYFSRVRAIIHECRHAGIIHSDKEIFKRALKGGNDNRIYEATYQRFTADTRAAERDNTRLSSFEELECAMLDIDESQGLNNLHNTRHRSGHVIFSAGNSYQTRSPNQQGRSQPPPSNALFRTRDRNNDRTCTYCNKTGHTQHQCRKKIRDAQANRGGRNSDQSNRNRGSRPPSMSTYRPSGRYANNGQNTNGQPRNRSSQRTRFSESERREWIQSVVCNHCGQTGHYANRCPRRNQQGSSNGPRFPRPNNGRNSRPSGNRQERAFLAYTSTDPGSSNNHEQLCVAVNEDDFPPFREQILDMNFDSFNTEAINQTDDDSDPDRTLSIDYSPLNSVNTSISTPSPQRMSLDSNARFNQLVRSDPSALFEPEDPLSLHQRFGTTELPNWLPDSGATSHHTPCLGDLNNPQECHIPVKLADGTIKHATHYGDVVCPFFTDDGIASTISLEKVYYTPGLNQRLLSLTCITGTENFSIGINNQETTIGLPNGKTFTWAYHRSTNIAENIEMALAITDNTASDNEDPGATVMEQSVQKGTRSKSLSTLPLELTSQRLGFKNIRTLMAGSVHKVWRDHQLYPSTASSNWPIRIAVSHKRARKKVPIPQPKEPFHMIHLDLIKNPFQFGITTNTNFSAYLFIVVTPGKLVGWLGLHGESHKDIFQALDRWLLNTQLRGRVNTVRIIRADAGTAFTTEKFAKLCADKHSIKIEAAAPHHQEQNGMCEAKWRELHATANSLLNNARLGGAFFHHAHAYAAEIINAIPAKDVTDEFDMPTTPYYVCYRRKPTLANFRVFGCPTFFKRYEPIKDGKVVTRAKQIQKAIRGIFVGFPTNSAGWLMYSAECANKLTISNDVHFDELFKTALSFDSKPFAGSVPIRTFADPSTRTNRHFDIYEDASLKQTGSVADHGIAPSSYITQDVDVVEEAERDDNNDKNETIAATRMQEYRMSYKTALESPSGASALHVLEKAMAVIEADYDECNDTIPYDCSQETAYVAEDSPTEDVYKYLPEPQSFRAILKCDPDVMKAWMHALGEELRNLISHGTFILGETPTSEELIIAVKLVLKAKQTAEGLLEKLKARLVARGDMEKRRNKKIQRTIRQAIERQRKLDKESPNSPVTKVETLSLPEDTWSPSATSRLLKIFLAVAALAKRQVKGADFIGAYLQSKVVGRHFVRLPKEYAEYFPQYAKYFGVPLLLAKGMYGLVYSGKFWNIEFSEWLFSKGFVQSKTDPSYFVLRKKHGEWLRVIFYVDDMLYFGSNDAIEKEFQEQVKRRFDVKFLGPAQWFLQMRIHRHADMTYTLDQQRYALNALRRYDPKEIYPQRKTPLPPDYIYSKENQPKNPKEKAEMERNFPDIHFRSAVCTLLYLAYNTRADILFAVCKLAKACICPGPKDHQALRWLIGYIRYRPDLAIRFYPDKGNNPISKLCRTARVPESDTVGFTDASFHDCPDTGRSTIGHLIFYNGALIDANSSLPTPVAMSSAESEYLAACNGAMAIAHLRMLLYDVLYLGSKEWSMAIQKLTTTPSILMVDNEAAVQMAKNGKMTRKTRHISRRFHYVRQGQQDGVHQLHWISNVHQLADVTTKTQVASKIDPFIPKIFYKLPKHLTQPKLRTF